LYVADLRVHPALTRQLDHARGEIDGNDLGSRLTADPFRKLAPAAADLQDARRLRGDHSGDQWCARVDGGALAGKGRRAPPQARIVRVFVCDE